MQANGLPLLDRRLWVAPVFVYSRLSNTLPRLGVTESWIVVVEPLLIGDPCGVYIFYAQTCFVDTSRHTNCRGCINHCSVIYFSECKKQKE